MNGKEGNKNKTKLIGLLLERRDVRWVKCDVVK